MQDKNTKEDERLYNAIIAALVIGIIIVIATLIFMRPAPEYFTEIYYTNHTLLPKYIETGVNYSFEITLANHEASEKSYPLEITAELTSVNNTNTTIYIESRNVTVPKDGIIRIPVIYSLPRFYRAKIISAIPNQEIHFFTYNKEAVFPYPDTVASLLCLNEIKIQPVNNFTIRARGSYNPNMKVRIDGREIYSTVVNNSDYQDFVISQPLNNSILDIIFDNDFGNQTIDRNLYIGSIQIGNNTIYPLNLTYNLGQGINGFDCQNTRKVNGNLLWNGALRFKVVS